MTEPKVIILHGPTAAGDEKVLAELAKEGWRLVSATDRRAYLEREITPAAGQPMNKLFDTGLSLSGVEASTPVEAKSTQSDSRGPITASEITPAAEPSIDRAPAPPKPMGVHPNHPMHPKNKRR